MRRVDPTERIEAALRIHRAAGRVFYLTQTDGESAAQEALVALQTVMPVDCVALFRWERASKSHTLVANEGYPEEAIRRFETVQHSAPSRPGVRHEGTLLRLADLPDSRRTGALFNEVIGPLGFSDGVSMCLNVEGACIGALHASTSGCNYIDSESLGLLRLLSDSLATIADPVRALLPATVTDGTGSGAFAWDEATGRTVELAGNPRTELVAPASPLVNVIGLARGRSTPGSHLILVGRTVLKIEVAQRGTWTICEHREVEPPFGLTHREMEVWAELGRGGTNRGIAAQLTASERTVTSHVERVLMKLRVANRAGAAAEAAKLRVHRLAGRSASPSS